ncbi:hypothetical protein QFC19_009198 [Naganishia cerealis]|uniref:Uncharacterized protein n=1 Tax=Naganishia cerealis TaxID=610337 RepID=A0ACC2UXZ7_9TREE|nr:hypothetical protein QFC19_009198 [Naganishia cerealis]
MPPLGVKDLTMPAGMPPSKYLHRATAHHSLAFPHLAAFTMVFVLGSYIYSSIGSAKENAAKQKAKNYERALEQRKHLGMDAWDQRAERERLRKEKGWASNIPPETQTRPTEKEV